MNIKLKGLDPISLSNWNSHWSLIVGGCVVSQIQESNYKKVQVHYCIIQTFGFTVLLWICNVKSYVVMNLTFLVRLIF